MSVSIYYTAKRDHKLSEDEETAVRSIADKYCAGYPYGEKYEDFCLYESPFDEADTVLQGSTAVPADSDEVYEIILYWLECLTEITRKLKGCTWYADLDDIELIWDGSSCHLPNEI